MKIQEELYSNTPPSLKDKRIKPFLESKINPFCTFWADKIFELMIKKEFSGLRIKNLDNMQKRDFSCPNIVYGPHICWWDGILAYYLCRKIFDFETIGMMENLHSLPILRTIGAFSVDKKSPKVIKESLNFAVNTLQKPQKALFIFPQGIIRPQDYMPMKFTSGISYIASNLDGVNLIPLAIRYNFLRAKSPEILIEIPEPIYLEKVENRNETTQKLQEHFASIIEKQRLEIARGQLEDYQTIWQKPKGIIDTFKNILTPR